MNSLINHYIKVLADKITKEKGENIESTIEAILDNLKYLAHQSTSTPEPTYWIPLEIKRILLFILYEGKAVIETTISEMKNNQYAEAISRIIVNDMVIASCDYRVIYESIAPFAGYSPDRRNALMREQVKGSAETRALYRAGIAMEFTGDIVEMSTDDKNQSIPEETKNSEGGFNEEVANNLMNVRSESSTLPSFPYSLDEEKITQEDDVVLFGKSSGKKLSEVSLDYKAYMLAYIEAGLEIVPKEYEEKLREEVLADEKVQDKYKYYQKLAASKKDCKKKDNQ